MGVAGVIEVKSWCVSIEVSLTKGQFDSDGQWPPAPARLFQALLAGCGTGAQVDDRALLVLSYLQKQPAPYVGAPESIEGRIPNKRSFDSRIPLLYIWRIDEDPTESLETALAYVVSRLTRLGQSIDTAVAEFSVLSDEDVLERLREYSGQLYYPTQGVSELALDVPIPGSLESLRRRFRASQVCSTNQEKSSLPHAWFYPASYALNVPKRIYTIRLVDENSTAGLPIERVAEITLGIRDAAAKRLVDLDPSLNKLVEYRLIGRAQNNKPTSKASDRIRLTLLPTYGKKNTDLSIRQLLVQAPITSGIEPDDVFIAFNGLELSFEFHDSEFIRCVLIQEDQQSLLKSYGFEGCYGSWNTITPIALPQNHPRCERSDQALAKSAVRNALRHANILSSVKSIKVQKESFLMKGGADVFSTSRFTKETLWHARIDFGGLVSGPIIIGDGRFLGLGLMVPIQTFPTVFAFNIVDGLEKRARALDITYALRRTVMARAQEVLGQESLPPYISGHEPDSPAPLKENSAHIAHVYDPLRMRLLIITPGLLSQHRKKRDDSQHRKTLCEALDGFKYLKAGPAGVLELQPAPFDMASDPLFLPANKWRSVTPYRVTRHAKKTSAEEVLVKDLIQECQRRGLPKPEVEVLKMQGVSKVGLEGQLQLRFNESVRGPLILGQSRHFGGGLFNATS